MTTAPSEGQTLRAQQPNSVDVNPEDTQRELLAVAAKESRKDQEAETMRQDRDATARGWTDEQAKARAARDAADHGDLAALGKRGDSDSFYLRSDMAQQASVNPVYSAALQAGAPELYARVQDNEKENVFVDLSVNRAAIPVAGQPQPGSSLTAAQEAEDLRKRIANEAMLAALATNAIDVQQSGREIKRDEMILPRRIATTYTELEGKFYAKDSSRLIFEDKGNKLASSSTDKKAVADMVTYAKAKQWDSFQLTGSVEFKREAWLQAESQGIKTLGYNPKDTDLVALKTLTAERSTNAITPLQERKRDVAAPSVKTSAEAAPRHDLDKNQAAMHVEASKSIARNILALQQRPAMADRSTEDLAKLAYWRGIVQEETKLQPEPAREEAIARFDQMAEDPQLVKRLGEETRATINDKTVDRVQKRDTHEQSL